ncbi:MAG TPA: XdhC family protein [Nocardioidaceae bacterium]|nr:XdhC family protein [Nocardioidaceae bacterium]
MTVVPETPTVLVVGAGEVATALRAFTTTLGWSAVVVESLEDTLAALPGAEVVVVTSHQEGVDGPAIAAALAQGTPYIGAMGSRSTQARRREWMLANGVSQRQVDSVHAPVGLDIGADTPAEIALAIVAEIVAVRRGASGGSLEGRPGPIHPGLDPGTAECPAG